MTIKTVPFDRVSELSSDAAITEYLQQVFKDGDSDERVGWVSEAQPDIRPSNFVAFHVG